MNYLELTRRLKLESGRSGDLMGTFDGLNLDDQRLVAWLADAWREVETDRLWDWQRAHTAPLTWTSGELGMTPTLLGLTNHREWWPQERSSAGAIYRPMVYEAGAPENRVFLDWVEPQAFRNAFVLTQTQSGVPRYWTASEGKFWIGPAPTGDWRLVADYRTAVQELVDETDVPTMSDELHLLLVWRALREVAFFDAAPELQIRADTNFQRLFADLVVRHSQPFGYQPRPL